MTNLPTGIISHSDLTALIFELKAYEKWFRHAVIKRTVSSLQAQIDTPQLSEAALEIITDQSNKELISQQDLSLAIADLETYQSSLPSLTITLAAPPPQSLKIELANWCYQNISHNLLINFRFNSTLLGGMVVQCGSRVYDWSWRRSILNNRGKFAEVLRRV